MRKVKLIIAAAAMLGLVSSSAVYADGFAPGEGLYIGAIGGGDFGIAQAKVTTEGYAAFNTKHLGGTFENTDGGLGLAGIIGGGVVGYGYKMGDLYAGLEGEMTAGDVEFKITSSIPVEISGGTNHGDQPCAVLYPTCGTDVGDIFNITAIEATKKWTGGMFGRLGYYINKETLLAVKGGVSVSKFDAKITGSTDFSETYYGGGPSFGASLESRIAAIDPNLSFRIGAVYTDFLTASVYGIGGKVNTRVANRSGHDSEVTGANLSARFGIQYSFFDMNSFF